MWWNVEQDARPDGPLEPVRSLWIGEKLPAAQRACIASFLRVGHPFELFVYDHVEGIPADAHVRDAARILPRERIFRYGPAAGRAAGGLGGFSDLFRFTLLLREGGYWVDTDNFCLRPFPSDDLVISSERGRDQSAIITSGVMKCPAEHEFARYCFERAIAADPATMQHGQIGPDLVREAVQALGLEGAINPPQTFCPVDWFNYKALCEPGTMPTDAAGVHLWGEMWRRWHGEIPWPGPQGSMMLDLAEILGGQVAVA